ncbi:hypothetical protein C8N43_0880 [Litoreibacter ponti]|uniref:Ketoreductase domain-containing protein n=1 Tax=Litoreibacter ponti TaxID=1510457 RepID=A0A2T6BJI5_9RHOB|nr:SDR family oxidoreductase [Litoreibacter ponti]PTX56227.1 hypothetical protein C8N43_0880 [Litoreibacter ponti]
MGYVLITGASEGIGKAIALRAAQNDRNMILAARSEDKLNALADEIKAKGLEAHVILSDLNEDGAAAKLWEQASAIGQIDVLVNNAGLGINGPFGDVDAEREDATMQVNMIALTQLMRLAVRDMKAAGKGRILNVASTAAFLPGPHMSVYHASKSYVLSLSEAVAQELSGTDVSVTALCPGPTRTEFFDEADMNETRFIKADQMMSAKEVADQGWVGMNMGQRIVVPGAMNKISAFLPRILPRSLITWITAQLYKRT